MSSFSFLAVWPGTFLYHLISLLVIEAGLGLAWDMQRRTAQPVARSFVVCFAGLLLGRLGQLLLSLLEAPLIILAPSLALGPLFDQFLTLGMTLLIIWAFVLPHLLKAADPWRRYFFPAQIAGGLGVVLLCLGWQVSMPGPDTLSGQIMLWQGWQVVLYGLAIGLLVRRSRAELSMTLVVALAVLGLGHLGHLLLPLTPEGSGLERFGALVGYPLLLLVVYQAIFRHLPTPAPAVEAARPPASTPPPPATERAAPPPVEAATPALTEIEAYQDELQAYKDELQTVSQEAAYRQEEMIFLLETSRAVNSSLELDTVLQQTAQYIALAVRADAAVIALIQADDPHTLKIVTGYDPLSKEVWEMSQIQLNIKRYPMLKKAVTCGAEPIIVQDTEPSAELLTLHAALGSSDIGPLLIQPLCHRDEALGVLMLGNARHQNLFSYSDGWLCQTMADQVSGAIVNARLYDEVTSLLSQRQTDVSQRQAILDSVTDGVMVVDKQARVTMVNPAASHILNRSQQKLLGQPLAQICPPLAKTEYAVFEQDDFIIAANRSPVRLPDQTVLGQVAVLRDVTREREAERAKSRFIEMVSHELRTPLTAVKGYTDLLLNGAVQPGSAHYQKFVGTIKTNTERLLVIVNNMIAVSEMDGKRTLILQAIDVGHVLEEALTKFEIEIAQRDLVLAKQFKTDLPTTTGDPLRLRQVFDNLLSNAIKYTQPGGRITVSTGFIPPEESEGEGFIRISISDTGVGIPADEVAEIFERFYRADNPLQIEAGGPGVGLTVARHIVEQHGGYIWVSSTVSQGSKFHVALPVTGPDHVAKPVTPAPVLAHA